MAGYGVALPPLSDATLPARSIARSRVRSGAGCLPSGRLEVAHGEQAARIGPQRRGPEAAAGLRPGMERNPPSEEACGGTISGHFLLVLVVSARRAPIALGLVWLFFFPR